MLKFECYFNNGDITEEAKKSLWDQGVNLDDTDILLLTFDVDQFTFTHEGEIYPIDSAVDRMLTGCCHNQWFSIQWNGEPAVVGVSYHA